MPVARDQSGIYLLAGQDRTGQEQAPSLLRTVGPFQLGCHGELSSVAEDPRRIVFFEGVLLSDREPGRSDAEVALARAEKQGPLSLRDLDGFFQLILVEKQAHRAFVVHDPMSTRVAYRYQGSGVFAVAPNPLFFADWNLPMELDRQGLFQLFRFCHPIGKRSWIRQVYRCRPLTTLEIDAAGGCVEHAPDHVDKRSDASIGLRTAADRCHREMTEILHSLTTHPKLSDKPIHLPLTAGMDSRHMLAVLLELDRAPATLWHVILKECDYLPVAAMSRDLEIPLRAYPVAEIDHARVFQNWLERTAGIAHYHQMYTMSFCLDLPPRGVLGLDGHLADMFYSFFQIPPPFDKRHYTPTAVRLIFPDREALAAQCAEEVQVELDFFHGPRNFKLALTDSFNRGLSYTGPIFPIMSEQAHYFGPGAHGKALRFFCEVPHDVGDLRRARLRAFRDHLPRLSGYPSEFGPSYLDMETLGTARASVLPDALRWLTGALTLQRIDSAPLSEHEWFRKVPTLRTIAYRLSRESRLAADGHIASEALRILRMGHNMGGYLAYALMSALTAEVAYRLLVQREAPDQVCDWLLCPRSPC